LEQTLLCSLFCRILLSAPAHVRESCGSSKIKPPHITICHHFQHFAWLKFQAVPSKILNIVFPAL